MDTRTQFANQLLEASKAAQVANAQAHEAAVARLRQGAQQRRSLAAPPPKLPLDFLAIGDSWFEYPLTGNGLPIVNTAIAADSQLGAMGNPPPRILNQALHGQATTAMLSYENQEQIRTVLTDPTQWVSGYPDAILVSAGGDNIAGDQFAIYVDYGGTGGLDQTRYDALLDDVRASYFDLFAFRDIFAPGVPVIGHCYDYGLPNGIHPICAGPWLQPSLDFAGYDYSQGLTIIRNAIDGFHAMLQDIAANHTLPPGKTTNNFILVDTRNTLTPDTSQTGWANELHPYPTGFNNLAKKFLAALQVKFPGRI
jgi:hypothetical protein